MSCGNFKVWRNKMFIGVFWNGKDDYEEHLQEWAEQYAWNCLARSFEKNRDEIFGELKDFVSLESGYYEGASICIRYDKVMETFDYNWSGAKKRKALRIKLEKKLQKLFKILKEENAEFDIMWMGVVGSFSNGETFYKEYEEWKEEI